MIYSNQKVQIVCEDSKAIITSQPPILAKYLTEDFKAYQTLNSSETLNRSCKHSKLVLYHALKERGFTPSEINFCAMFLMNFTQRILKEAIHAFNGLYIESSSDYQIIHTKLAEIIATISSSYIKDFESQFNLHISSH